MTITVVEVAELGDEITVAFDIGGVDDPDGTDEFRLVVPGESLRAAAGSCERHDGRDAAVHADVRPRRRRRNDSRPVVPKG